MIKELVPHTDEILSTELEKFDLTDSPMDPNQLAHELAQTMIMHNGLGLSANQIGYPYRVFVMTGNPITCCINPRILDVSEETILMDEGCLSYPGLSVKVRRPRVIRVRYTQLNGEIVTRKFQDLTARVFQHEMDHLDGINMIDRCSFMEQKHAKKRLKKLEQERLEKKFHVPGLEI